ncbi:MAG: hypothetical protein AB2385_12735 [Symbiobacterium sp.]|uniref:hypothetical protein n=1 Tax=Symbiobacterium sp. TaxID=1971213 RepID=UPI003464C454
MRRHVGMLLLCGSAFLIAGLSLKDTVSQAAVIGWCLGFLFTLLAVTVAVIDHLRGDWGL